jgi:hypothetical protein
VIVACAVIRSLKDLILSAKMEALKATLAGIFAACIMIPRSLIHPRYWLRGPAIRHINWQPQYPGEEKIMYEDPVRVNTESTGQEITKLREQMGHEEGARFDAQIEVQQRKLNNRDWQASSGSTGLPYWQP